MTIKAVTIGGAMLDSIAIVESNRIERVSMRNAETSFLLLEEGRKTEASEISTHCGGGAINTAVAMARLGCDVSTLVKLGQDARADQILTRLSQEGVSTRWVMRVSEAPTGASVLVSSHERDAAIFTFRGANTLLRQADLKDDMFATDLVYISSLSNESADCFPDLIAKARQNGAIVATNPGIRQLSARADRFYECLASIDMLSINRTEADALVPRLVAKFGERGPVLPLKPEEEPPALAARGLSSGGFEMTLPAFMGALIGLGVKTVVITDGAAGSFVGCAEGIYYCPPLPADVHGTAGAGDAFASSYVALVTLGRPIDEALALATINASSVIGHADTQTGLLTLDQLEEQFTASREKIAVRHWPL